MRKHVIKILPLYYKAVIAGMKNFELRKNDRDYQVGDTVRLEEYDGENCTGRYCTVVITYVLKDVPGYGLEPGHCIFGWRSV